MQPFGPGSYRTHFGGISGKEHSGPDFLRRHASEQYFTSSQFLAHFFRQVMTRPHAAHGLLGRYCLLPRNGGSGRVMRRFVRPGADPPMATRIGQGSTFSGSTTRGRLSNTGTSCRWCRLRHGTWIREHRTRDGPADHHQFPRRHLRCHDFRVDGARHRHPDPRRLGTRRGWRSCIGAPKAVGLRITDHREAMIERTEA